MDIRAVIRQLRKSADELEVLIRITEGHLGRPVGRPRKIRKEPNKQWTPAHRAAFMATLAKKRQERGVKKSAKLAKGGE